MRGLVLTLCAMAAGARPARAAGECVVASDCAVFGARCEAMRCTIQTSTILFPALAISDLLLADPPDLAARSASPAFSWQPPTGADLITVVIFAKRPRYDERLDEISNFADAVWVWHSNLPGSSISMTGVAYQQGRALAIDAANPVDADALQSGPPRPLAPGAYYWGAWGWNGVELTHRSALRSFVVETEHVTGSECGNCAPTSCVTSGAADVPYCVLPCASNIDCYEDMFCDLSVVELVPWGICRPDAGPPRCECGEDEYCDDKLTVCVSVTVSDAACSGAGGSRELWPVVVALLLLGWPFAVSSSRRRPPYKRARLATGRDRAARARWLR